MARKKETSLEEWAKTLTPAQLNPARQTVKEGNITHENHVQQCSSIFACGCRMENRC